MQDRQDIEFVEKSAQLITITKMKHITLTIIFIIALISYINTTAETIIASENHSIYPIPAGLSGVVVEPRIEQDTKIWLTMYLNQCQDLGVKC